MIQPYYQDKFTTLYNCDWKDIINNLPVQDLLCTDPPYGIKLESDYKSKAGRLEGAKDWGDFSWDDNKPSKEDFDKLLAISRYQVIWGGNYFGLPATSCYLVWDKENGSYSTADCELAWTNYKKAVRMIKCKWHGFITYDMKLSSKERRVHPAQKALPVMEFSINHAPDDIETIFDPFAGSGTTAVAALNLMIKSDRKFKITLVEREIKYCDEIVKRLKNVMEKFRMMEEAKEFVE